MMKRIWQSSLFAVTAIATPFGLGARSGDVAKFAKIYPQRTGQLIENVFFDLKSPWAAKQVAEGDSLYNAKTLFADDGFNGIRTSIYGTRDHQKKNQPGKPAHPRPGVVDKRYYEQEVEALRNALAVNPDLKIFASKKLNGRWSFPIWTLQTDTNGDGVADRDVDPQRYAVLLADYIEFMANRDIPTHYLGVDNERRFNEGNISPKVHAEIVERFKDELRRRNTVRHDQGLDTIPVPLVVGPEDFYPGKDAWMGELERLKLGETVDVYGTHYYPEDRDSHYHLLKRDVKVAAERPSWHTELHWNTLPHVDDFEESVGAVAALWDCIDLGMTGFMWWHYQREENKLRGDLMRSITTHLLGYRPAAVDDFDGCGIRSENKLLSRALKKENEIRFFAMNASDRAYDEFEVSLVDSSPVESATYHLWVDHPHDHGANSSEGQTYHKLVGTLDAVDGATVRITLPPRSMTEIVFKI